ncbi:unnamed protein product [Acanthoscelides obtectus]|uniref:Uncharacterized protein n=1 Tax=Acanthoscelides obtectus TaxID=200917 RepID=A0A9P0VQY0_ACAOB|nr:unnamed protein product [Acanthoscelides obtectus]CAK1656864.1 hypothetical protein AOBTE_LOCUS19975 [Acanthoscelides obtectus]
MYDDECIFLTFVCFRPFSSAIAPHRHPRSWPSRGCQCLLRSHTGEPPPASFSTREHATRRQGCRYTRTKRLLQILEH